MSSLTKQSHPPTHGAEDETPVDKDEVIRGLLQVCRTRGIDVPPGLLARIHAVEDPTKPYILTERERRRSTHYLKQRCQRQVSRLDEVEQIIRLLRSVGEGRLKFELRVHDATYVVSRTEHGSAATTTTTGDDTFDVEEGPGSPSSSKSETKDKPAQISNILNSSPIYKAITGIAGCWKGVARSTIANKNEILGGVNLHFTSGKSYLVLGAPGSGKSLLLKYIANILRQNTNRKLGGKVTLNGKSPIRRSICWSNLVAYTDQIDRLHSMVRGLVCICANIGLMRSILWFAFLIGVCVEMAKYFLMIYFRTLFVTHFLMIDSILLLLYSLSMHS